MTESFLILWKENRAADYALLLRSFWEMAINTDYIFRDKERKKINALRYLLHEYQEKIKLLVNNRKEFEANGHDVAARKEKIEKEYEKDKASFFKNFPTEDMTWPKIYQRAKDSPSWVIKQAYNFEYAYLCSVEHHDPALGKYYVEDGECKPRKSVQRPFLLRPEINLLMCRGILLVIMKTFNDEFCLRWRDKLKQLEDKQDREYKEMVQSEDEAKGQII